MVRTTEATYTEPAQVPDGCVRIRWLGNGSTLLNDFRGWKVRMNEGDNLIVSRETWDWIDSDEFTGNRRHWELAEG